LSNQDDQLSNGVLWGALLRHDARRIHSLVLNANLRQLSGGGALPQKQTPAVRPRALDEATRGRAMVPISFCSATAPCEMTALRLVIRAVRTTFIAGLISLTVISTLRLSKNA
jgi:hypothetical protein